MSPNPRFLAPVSLSIKLVMRKYRTIKQKKQAYLLPLGFHVDILRFLALSAA
jgi:hypothetical protein